MNNAANGKWGFMSFVCNRLRLSGSDNKGTRLELGTRTGTGTRTATQTEVGAAAAPAGHVWAFVRGRGQRPFYNWQAISKRHRTAASTKYLLQLELCFFFCQYPVLSKGKARLKLSSCIIETVEGLQDLQGSRRITYIYIRLPDSSSVNIFSSYHIIDQDETLSRSSPVPPPF